MMKMMKSQTMTSFDYSRALSNSSRRLLTNFAIFRYQLTMSSVQLTTFIPEVTLCIIFFSTSKQSNNIYIISLDG